LFVHVGPEDVGFTRGRGFVLVVDFVLTLLVGSLGGVDDVMGGGDVSAGGAVTVTVTVACGAGAGGGTFAARVARTAPPAPAAPSARTASAMRRPAGIPAGGAALAGGDE
jgi:hypothetical protein